MSPDDFPELRRYKRIVFEDFEFATSAGDRPRPVCCTALEWRTGRVENRWLWGRTERPPFDHTTDDLYVAFHAPAELCCRLVLGWPLPPNVLDLCVEYKLKKNGLGGSRNLIAALMDHGIDVAEFADKHEMQMLAARGGPFTEQQRLDLSSYNERDVRALELLLPAMLPQISLPHALFRGRYMAEVSKIEHHGIPINCDDLQALADNWEPLKAALIQEVDKDYGVFEGTTFKERRWEEWVARRGLPWPRLASGRITLHRDVFKRMAERYPEVAPVRALRSLLSQFRHFELPVGTDGRTRCGSYTFGTITGRNTPNWSSRKRPSAVAGASPTLKA
jgi:hypothetical protein